MKISDISKGDTLVSTDKNGTGYYRVVKVNRVTIGVVAENGSKFRCYPTVFDRKVDYDVPTLPKPGVKLP